MYSHINAGCNNLQDDPPGTGGMTHIHAKQVLTRDGWRDSVRLQLQSGRIASHSGRCAGGSAATNAIASSCPRSAICTVMRFSVPWPVLPR